MSNGLEYFEGDDGLHYFRIKAQNGKTVAISEAYKTKQSAEKGAVAVAKAITIITDDTPPGVEDAIVEEISTTPEALDLFADTYGAQLHPTAVPSSAYVIGKDRETLRSLLEAAAEDGWTIVPPQAEDDEQEDPQS